MDNYLIEILAFVWLDYRQLTPKKTGIGFKQADMKGDTYELAAWIIQIMWA